MNRSEGDCKTPSSPTLLPHAEEGTNKLQGISLLELMLASALSSFIVLAVWQGLAIQQRAMNQIHHHMAVDVELASVASILRDRIRHAGFSPCLSLAHLVTLDEEANPLLPYQLDELGQRLTLNRMGDAYQEVTVINDHELRVNRQKKSTSVHLISDCFHAELVRISQHDRNGILLQHPLRFSYQPPVFLGEWQSESFEVIKGKGLMLHGHRSDVLSDRVQQLEIHLLEDKQRFRLKLQVEVDHLARQVKSYWVVATMRMRLL